MPTVRDILVKKGSFVASVGRDATVLDAAREMNARRIGSVVVTEGDRVVGIFTERDILTKVVAQQLDPQTTKVGEVMSTPVACCRPETELEECRSVMTEKRIRHLPVVEEGRLVGIITSGDILAQQAAEQARTIQYYEQYIYGPYPLTHEATSAKR